MIQPKKFTSTQAGEIARIHLESFPNSFLTSLGHPFLEIYYRSCAKSQKAISICAVDNETGNIVGFAVGCKNSKGFNKHLLRTNMLPFLLQLLKLLFTRPFVLVRLLKNMRKTGNVSDNGNYAELLSIAVLPNQRIRGVGKILLTDFEKTIANNKIMIITLTTDAHLNDNVLRFYINNGYEVFYQFVAYPRREMLKLIKNAQNIEI